MECDARAAGKSDNLAGCDWTMCRHIAIVKEVVEGDSKDLIESVVEEIAGRILEELNVSAVSCDHKEA